MRNRATQPKPQPTPRRYVKCNRCNEHKRLHAKGQCGPCYRRTWWENRQPDRIRKVPARGGLVRVTVQVSWTVNDALVELADRLRVTRSLVVNVILQDILSRDGEAEEVLRSTAVETLRKVPLIRIPQTP